MKITNNASFPVIAFGTYVGSGYGDDVLIQPGEFADVGGPYLGEMGRGRCHIHIDGEIVCQELPDDENGLQIAKGTPICLQSGDKGITIRHHMDPAEDYVLAWRTQPID